MTVLPATIATAPKRVMNFLNSSNQQRLHINQSYSNIAISTTSYSSMYNKIEAYILLRTYFVVQRQYLQDTSSRYLKLISVRLLTYVVCSISLDANNNLASGGECLC